MIYSCGTVSMQNDPTEDGINYSGIAFPTPLKDFDKLEAQNQNVAINVFFFFFFFFCGWKGRVTVYRVSEKPNEVTQINLKVTASSEV